MALIFDVNQTDAVNNLGSFLYAIKTALTGAGWILKGTGDGTSNSSNVATETNAAATDYFTSPTIAATNRAWFRYRTPNTMSNGTYRELTFQALKYITSDMGGWAFGTDMGDGGVIRVKYSLCISGSGFVSGTISANSGTTPSAKTSGDEYIVAGSRLGTDTGSAAVQFELGGGLLRPYQFNSANYFWSTAANNQAPYQFYIFSYAKTSKTDATFFCFHNVLSGTYDNNDIDPNIFTCYGGTGFNATAGHRIHSAILGNSSMVEISKPSCLNLGQGHISAEDNLLPCKFFRDESATEPRGWKGISGFIYEPSTFASRANLDTYSINSTRDKIYVVELSVFGNAANAFYPIVDWDGSVPSF